VYKNHIKRSSGTKITLTHRFALLNISQESALTTPTIVLFSHQATHNAEWDEGRMQGEFGLAADEEGRGTGNRVESL